MGCSPGCQKTSTTAPNNHWPSLSATVDQDPAIVPHHEPMNTNARGVVKRVAVGRIKSAKETVTKVPATIIGVWVERACCEYNRSKPSPCELSSDNGGTATHTHMSDIIA